MSRCFESAVAIREAIRPSATVTLVGGGFDLLHVGHLHLLNYAKTLADVLVVAVLSDEYIKSYKGPLRPVINERYRAELVASLRQVDYAFISYASSYNSDTLRLLRPNNLVYGTEIDPNRMSVIRTKANAIKKDFPQIAVHYLTRFSDHSISTGAIVQRVKNLQ